MQYAVSIMKNIKSLCLDCLPNEFYKSFWNLTGPVFYEVLLTVFDNQELSFSQRLSLMTVLFKKGDKNNMEILQTSHRLTDTDYKITPFIFESGFQKVIDGLIGIEQSAYIYGRFIWKYFQK